MTYNSWRANEPYSCILETDSGYTRAIAFFQFQTYLAGTDIPPIRLQSFAHTLSAALKVDPVGRLVEQTNPAAASAPNTPRRNEL